MRNLETIIAYSFLVPMGDPRESDCIMGLPLILWGEPGIGKSSRVRFASHALGLLMEPVYPATRQPEDFSGVPVVNLKGELSIECILGAVRTLMLFEEGVLFLEEVSCARPAVQASLLSVVLDRRIGDTVLNPGIRIILAANPEDSAAGGWELAPPMANRMGHIDVPVPSSEDWLGWLFGTQKSPILHLQDGMQIVQDSWDSVWARARGIIGGFIKRKGDSLHLLPPAGHADRGRAWPSPRTWDFAARAVATCLALDPAAKTVSRDASGQLVVNNMAHLFVKACVGEAAATEWATWLATSDLPDPEDVLKHGWIPDKRRLDRTYAVMASVAGYVIGRPTPEERNALAVPAWKLMQATCEAGMADIAMVAAEQLSRASLSIDSPDPAVKAAAKPVVLRLGNSGIDNYAAIS